MTVTGAEALTMHNRLFTAKDAEKCFPWIRQGATNHRVKIGALPIAHPSPGTGIPNLFTLPELVHNGVLDELATLGVFGKLHDLSISYIEPCPGGETSRGSGDPYFVDFSFYERWDYRVLVIIEIHHEDLPGTNVHDVKDLAPTEEIPFPHVQIIPRGWGRYYRVIYSPETNGELDYLESRLSYWRNPAKRRVNRTRISTAFIRVQPLHDLVVETLEL